MKSGLENKKKKDILKAGKTETEEMARLVFGVLHTSLCSHMQFYKNEWLKRNKTKENHPKLIKKTNFLKNCKTNFYKFDQATQQKIV